MSGAPQFTVFTPTYNRAHTLHRAFESLCAQTLQDFEWLVVDDGSTDKTEELVAAWAKVATFPIRYLKQPHSGKPAAHNLAVQEARGLMFVTLDSDDACVPAALERIICHWNAIPSPQRTRFSGIVTLCCNQFGNLVGDRFPSDPFDSDLREVVYICRVRGEKWPVASTEVLRRFPFPVIQNSYYTPESVVFHDIAKTYKIRCINEVLRIYYVDDAQTGKVISKRLTLSENASGRVYYYVWLFNNDLSYFFDSPLPFLKAAVMLPIVARASRQPFSSILKSLNGRPAKIIVLAALPLSFLVQILLNPSLVYVVDKVRARASAH